MASTLAAIPRSIIPSSIIPRRLLKLALIAAACNNTADALLAQQPGWQPTRVPAHSQARHISTDPSAGLRSAAEQSATKQYHLSDQTSAVQEPNVLRWKTRNSSQHSHNHNTASQQASSVRFSDQPQTTAVAAHQVFDERGVYEASPAATELEANPLRAAAFAQYAVQPAQYQQSIVSDFDQDPFLDDPPGMPVMVRQQQIEPGPLDAQPLPGLTPQEPLSDYPDPLDAPEPAPAPSGGLQLPGAPVEPTIPPQQEDVRANPFDDNLYGGQEPSASDDEFDLDIPGRDEIPGSLSCNELRDRLRSRPLAEVSLDVSPKYGEGLRSVGQMAEQERLEFASSSQIRSWTDYKGEIIATGRMIDLRNDRVVLDVDGGERSISIHELSDNDIAYVGDVWNIPEKCGMGNEAYAGRSFLPASVRWTAPGHCHKPLYFEQVQLERYGHDAGPVIQPLLSSAHFFANIAVLPYKMGIHPPHECQYSLGYIRPGNCAPYMLQPIPFSLRGAAVQAGFVTGAAALIP